MINHVLVLFGHNSHVFWGYDPGWRVLAPANLRILAVCFESFYDFHLEAVFDCCVGPIKYLILQNWRIMRVERLLSQRRQIHKLVPITLIQICKLQIKKFVQAFSPNRWEVVLVLFVVEVEDCISSPNIEPKLWIQGKGLVFLGALDLEGEVAQHDSGIDGAVDFHFLQLLKLFQQWFWLILFDFDELVLVFVKVENGFFIQSFFWNWIWSFFALWGAELGAKLFRTIRDALILFLRILRPNRGGVWGLHSEDFWKL